LIPRVFLALLALLALACNRPSFLGLGYDVVGTPLKGATHLVFLLHGYGAPARDLEGLARTLRHDCPPGTRFVLVEGPLAAGAGRAWFKSTEDVAETRHRLLDLVRSVARKARVPASAVAVAGFSQGGMVAVDVALHAEPRLGAAVMMSGGPVPGNAWADLAPKVAGTRFMVTHGSSDNVIPLSQGQAVRDLLEQAGHSVVFVETPGPHRIAPEVVQALPGFLSVSLSR
jgi:phospholipase/carboxylesterase